MNAIEAKLCQGKDIFERINYLYQTSRFIATRNKPTASYYGSILTSCARKAVLRLEPDVKRTICKTCQHPLLPGKTSRVRLVSKPVRAIKWTCLACNSTKKIPLKKGFKLWSDDPESLLQAYDYTPKEKSASISKSNERQRKESEASKVEETEHQPCAEKITLDNA